MYRTFSQHFIGLQSGKATSLAVCISKNSAQKMDIRKSPELFLKSHRLNFSSGTLVEIDIQ